MAGEKTWWNVPGFHLSYMEDYPPYPYQRIKSEDGKDTGVVALIAPFYDLTYYRVRTLLTAQSTLRVCPMICPSVLWPP